MARFTDEDMDAMSTEELEGAAVEGAAELEADESAVLEATAPEGDFSMRALNAVVDALNEINGLMGAPEYPTFEEDIELFPTEFMDNLNMVNQALTDAGMDEMSIDLMTMGDDKDLTLLAGELASLASDKDFVRFMRQQEREAPAPAPEEEVVEVDETIETPGMTEDIDALMMQRM